MRVWIMTSELPDESAGGIARYVGNYAPLLAAAGHEVLVITRGMEPRDEEMSPGVRLISFEDRYPEIEAESLTGNPDDHPAYPYNILSFNNALCYQFAEVVLGLINDGPPPDIIESQEYLALPYYLIQRKLTETTPLQNIPILVHMHSPSFELRRADQRPCYVFPEYWQDQMEKFCIVAADALLAPGGFLVESVEKTLGRPLDVARIPYPAPMPTTRPPTEGKPRELVYLGRLQVLKGVLPLVQSCAALWATGEDFRLTMIGGDTDFAPRGSTVAEYLRKRYGRWIEAGRLILTGRLAHGEAMQRLQDAWASVIPSLWENFPNTCIEAICQGQLVMGSSTGGQAEILQQGGGNGFLFDWDKPGDFERKLESVFSLSTEERRRIIRSGQQRLLELCAPETVVRQRVRHYEEILERYSPPTSFPTTGNLRRRATTSVADEHREEQAGLLSVIMPYYNLGEYVEESLDSVLVSTYSPFEVVIVNDGSTDAASLAALERIEKRGLEHVRIVTTANQGLPATRNKGAEESRGEFISFIDSDDLVEPEFFERAIAVLNRYSNVDFVYSWMRYFGVSNDIWPTWNAAFPYLLGHNMVPVLGVVRRSSFLRHGRNKPEIPYYLEDHESWISLIESGGVGVSLPHVLVRYRVRRESITQSMTGDAYLYSYGLLTRFHDETYREWGGQLYSLQNANGPAKDWEFPDKSKVTNPEAAAAYQDFVADLIEERDHWYQETLRFGDTLQQLRENKWLRLAARCRLFRYRA